MRLAETQEWATGRRPEDDREWQLEYSFRELENKRRNEEASRQQEYEGTFEAAKQSMRSTNVRSWVLLAIVASIILMPAIAMAAGIAAQSFSQYIAPITGIAGTVLGYWFSQQGISGPSDGSTKDRISSNPPQGSGFPLLPPKA
jgi:lipopolysaccharide export LptBFGC system permease protein LptF